MEITEIAENQIKITLKGRLDTAGVDRIEKRFIAAVVPRGRNAIVDLSQIDFVASMGIRMFISAARALNAKNAQLVLFAPQAIVREVFELASLGDIISICDDEASALIELTAP